MLVNSKILSNNFDGWFYVLVATLEVVTILSNVMQKLLSSVLCSCAYSRNSDNSQQCDVETALIDPMFSWLL